MIVGGPIYKEKNAVNEDKCKRVTFQIAMFIMTFFNYALLHATRSAWSMTTSNLTKNKVFSIDTVTYMNSTWLFCYSFFGIFLGHLGDKYRKNRVICFQFIGVAIIQTAIGLVVLATDQQNKWLPAYFLLKIFDGTL